MKRKSKQISHIKDLNQDPNNVRRHNPRNIGMIENSLNKFGAARSIVIDENGMIIAGNGLVEAAAQAGIHKVRVIIADGNEIIAVQRNNLSEEQKTLLALYDNRATDLSDINPHVLADLASKYTEQVGMLYFPDELAQELSKAGTELITLGDIATPQPKSVKEITCPNCGTKIQ